MESSQHAGESTGGVMAHAELQCAAGVPRQHAWTMGLPSHCVKHSQEGGRPGRGAGTGRDAPPPGAAGRHRITSGDASMPAGGAANPASHLAGAQHAAAGLVQVSGCLQVDMVEPNRAQQRLWQRLGRLEDESRQGGREAWKGGQGKRRGARLVAVGGHACAGGRMGSRMTGWLDCRPSPAHLPLDQHRQVDRERLGGPAALKSGSSSRAA